MSGTDDIERDRMRDVQKLIDQAVELGDVIVVCEDCGAEYMLTSVAENRKVPPEQVSGMRGVIDVGIFCPNCDKFHHSFYNTPRLRKIRQAMDKEQGLYSALMHGQVPVSDQRRASLMKQQRKKMNKAKRKMQRALDETQRLIRKKIDESEN